MDNDAIDFSALDPAGDPQRLEWAIDRINAAAAPVLARRRLQESVWWQLTAWRKPVLALGVATVLLLIGVAQYGETSVDEVAAESDDIALALGVPVMISGWVYTDSPPSTAQILYPVEE